MISDQFTVIMEPPHPPGWRMQPHAHIQSEFTFVRRGSCYLTLKDATYRLEEGSVIYLPGGVRHGHEPHRLQEVEFIVVQFGRLSPRLNAELRNKGEVGLHQLAGLEKSRFIDLCCQLQREIACGLPHTEILCHALVEQLAVTILRSGRDDGMSRLSSEQQEAIDRALDWIHEHINDRFMISDIAEYAGFSPAHFRLLFRRAVGIGPKQYVLALRLQSSKCMLMQDDHTITEVALRAGFNSPQAFSKTFRQFTGVTPSQWKEAHMQVV